jgi:hypothetical protein
MQCWYNLDLSERDRILDHEILDRWRSRASSFVREYNEAGVIEHFMAKLKFGTYAIEVP